MEQGHVRAGQAGEHHGIGRFALAFVAVMAWSLRGLATMTAAPRLVRYRLIPRAVRARFQRHGGGRIPGEPTARGPRAH